MSCVGCKCSNSKACEPKEEVDPVYESILKDLSQEEVALEVKLTVGEIAKLSLEKNDVLMVKIKGLDLHHDQILGSLDKKLKLLFPENRVMIFSMDLDHDIDMSVIKKEDNDSSGNI